MRCYVVDRRFYVSFTFIVKMFVHVLSAILGSVCIIENGDVDGVISLESLAIITLLVL